MSDEPNTPGQNEDAAVPLNPGPMNPGPTGEVGSAEFQRQPSGANPDGPPQNEAAAPETGSQAAPVEQDSHGEIVNVNTTGLVAAEQSEPTALVLLPGQAEIQTHQDPALAGAASSPADPVDEFSGPPEYSLIEKLLDSWALVSHDEYLARGHYANCWDTDLELYEPCESFDLVEKEGSINVSFVEWKGHRPRFSTHGWECTYNGQHYTVPRLPGPVYDAMHLPTHVTTDFAAHQVFEGLCRVLRGCPALSDQQCELLSFWCLATWFADEMDFIPRMTITGPRYAVDLLFALLSRVCRRAILLAGIKPATLQRIPIKEFMPTLLIRQVKPGKSASELLDASDRRRYFVACGKELLNFYCAKCVYVGEPYDAKHADNGLYIHLGRNSPSAKVAYPSAEETQHLQNQLFTYRSFYRDRFGQQVVQVSGDDELLLQLDMIAYRLCSVIFEDCELQERLVELLKTQNEQNRADGASGIEATVLKSVLSHCHENESQTYVRDIAATANRIWLEQGETSKLTNEKVGHVLKKLGLYSRRLNSQGRGLALDKAQQLRVHELAFEYDVLPVVPQCGHCHNQQAPPSKEVM